MRYPTSILLWFVLFITGCSKSPSTPPPVDPCISISHRFSADVMPIFVSTCSVNLCHDANSTNVGGAFVTHAQIFNKRGTIKAQVAAGLMPQTGSLSAEQKNKIICWIDSGAPNN